MDREELTFRFSQRYGKQIEEYENSIYDSASAIGKTGVRWTKSATNEEINAKILLCDACIDNFNNFRKYCVKKGKGGAYYFEDYWEHLHNSKNPCFSYIDSVLEQKKVLENALK